MVKLDMNKKGASLIMIVVFTVLGLIILGIATKLFADSGGTVKDTAEDITSCERSYFDGVCRNAARCNAGEQKLPMRHLCGNDGRICCIPEDGFGSQDPQIINTEPTNLVSNIISCKNSGTSCSEVASELRRSANNGERIEFFSDRIEFTKNGEIVRVELLTLITISVCEEDESNNIVNSHQRQSILEKENGEIFATVAPESIPLAWSKHKFLSFVQHSESVCIVVKQ